MNGAKKHLSQNAIEIAHLPELQRERVQRAF